MFIDPKLMQGTECETPLDAQLLLNADERGNAIHGMMIASAMAVPFWATVAYAVSAII
jgi:hypothetical protein